MLKLKAAFFLSVLALAACSGSGSSDKKEDVPADQQEQLVQQYNLPPAPDAELAKTQVIDTNANGIRDEVERAIVFEYGDNPKKVEMINMIVKMDQEDLSLDPEVDFDKIMDNAETSLLLTICLGELHPETEEESDSFVSNLEAWMYDTDERRNNSLIADSALNGQMLVLPDEEQMLTICDQFK